MNMKTAKKLFAVILIAVLSLSVIISSAYVISEADHNCTGADCEICLTVSLCRNTLKVISLGIISFALLHFLDFFGIFSLLSDKSAGYHTSPVSKKDKLLC